MRQYVQGLMALQPGPAMAADIGRFTASASQFPKIMADSRDP